ncbi:unnamed protein product [Durusdinium trenchii]|uniref:Peptidylprolyl isomerase n=1 Tax=Durusdinium trenchii TaxID=1381693 RepID=A0ABP0PDW2_9DINO
MADDSCSSASSLPDLEPVELAPQPDHVRPETSQHGGATDGPHILKLLTGDALHGQKEADPASIWDEEPQAAFSHWETEVKEETRRLMAQTCPDELCESELYGYPKWPPEMKDPQYFRNELMKMRNDPRQNPNHGRSMEDQEFWNEAARLPWAKVLLRKEQFWTERRNAWLQQYGKVIRGNRGRLQVAEQLEECSMELKRLVTPVLHYRVVEGLLVTALEEACELELHLSDFLEGPGRPLCLELLAACERLKHEPEKQAQMMQEELDGRLREAQDVALKEQEQQLRQQARTIIDMDGLRIALEYGQKCRKDGLVEYHRGNWDEALHSWRQGDLALRRFRAPLRCEVENGMLRELHGSVLRNLSQAALRAGCYQEALDASERAIALQGGRGLTEENAPWDVLGVGLEAAGEIDVKAWFRRHVALEALGQMQEAASCLQYIEEAAMGRADGERLRQDCQRCRDKLRQRQSRGKEEERRMLQRSLKSGVFSQQRDGCEQAGFQAPRTETLIPESSAASAEPRGRRTVPSNLRNLVVMAKDLLV